MENSGNSEFSNSNNQRYSMTFWQTFLLTLFGARGVYSSYLTSSSNWYLQLSVWSGILLD
jgi:hypothetical protein